MSSSSLMLPERQGQRRRQRVCWFTEEEYQKLIPCIKKSSTTVLKSELDLDTRRRLLVLQHVQQFKTQEIRCLHLQSYCCFLTRSLLLVSYLQSYPYMKAALVGTCFQFYQQEDQQVLRKRKTELSGVFSVAILILLIGLVTVLLYQSIHKRNVEVHRVKPANAPDLLSFVNDLEFDITTISSMSCAQAIAPSTIAMGTPGFLDFKVLPLSTLLITRIQAKGHLSLKCIGCWIPPRDHYVSW